MNQVTSAASAIEDDDEVLTLEPVTDDEGAGWLTPRTTRIAFISLAVIALLALVVAVLAIVLAPKSAVTILISALAVLFVVVVAEVVLLVLAKPRQA